MDKIVSKWVAKYPNSEWAHLFNYMIHFPIPNGSLASLSQSAKLSIKKCDQIVRDKTGIGFRKSGAEYFLGKGISLYAIVNSQEFRWLETKWETKTDFWRSKEISEKLESVCGQKDVNFKCVITYKGIQLRFGDTRYPKESKDDLWFYIGFSVAGPYAYDPVDSDTYEIMTRKTSENFYQSISTKPKDSSGAAVTRKRKFLEFKYPNTERSLGVCDEKLESPDKFSNDFPKFPSSDWPEKRGKPMSTSMPHFLNEPPSDSCENLLIDSNLASSSRASVPPGMSSWVSVDCVNLQATTSLPTSYAYALQHGSERSEEHIAKATNRQQSDEACGSLLTKSRKWKSIQGTRGSNKKVFQPKYVDKTGKLHHGAWVLGAEKSKECKVHTSKSSADIRATTRCPFAHSWRGDTLQYVCMYGMHTKEQASLQRTKKP